MEQITGKRQEYISHAQLAKINVDRAVKELEKCNIDRAYQLILDGIEHYSTMNEMITGIEHISEAQEQREIVKSALWRLENAMKKYNKSCDCKK